MPQPLWMSIEPKSGQVRLMLSEPASGTVLKAILPEPRHPRALPMLLEALSAWYQLPLHAALDADAQDVRDNPERWARWLGDLTGLEVSIEWIGRDSKKPRERFLETMGDFTAARRLVNFAATGQ